jgi:hypothetical protein
MNARAANRCGMPLCFTVADGYALRACGTAHGGSPLSPLVAQTLRSATLRKKYVHGVYAEPFEVCRLLVYGMCWTVLRTRPFVPYGQAVGVVLAVTLIGDTGVRLEEHLACNLAALPQPYLPLTMLGRDAAVCAGLSYRTTLL